MREQPSKVQLHIGGMTCVHCQEKIRAALEAADGVTEVSVSYGSGTADVSYDGEVVSVAELEQIIRDLDYEIVTQGEERKAFALLYPFLIFAVIVAVFVPLQAFGVLNYLAPSELADSGMGYGLLFVIGLITSVHCIAMCGGISLSQCIPKSTEDVPKGAKAILPAVFYNLGRLISYTLAGFILGLVGWAAGGGSSVGFSYLFQGIIKIVAGLLMIVMGVNMLGIVPALRKINPRMPKFIARKIGKKKASLTSPLLVGLLNGIMPCGPLQSMWLVALATGNPFSGALSMFLFAAGTVPLMLGFGSVVAKLGQKFTKTVMTVGSLLVVVLGLAMLSQGGGLTGFAFLSPPVVTSVVLALVFAGVMCSIPLSGAMLKRVTRLTACLLVVAVGAFSLWMSNRSAVGSSYDVSVVGEDSQTVNSVIHRQSYPNISVQVDIPVVWVIEADADQLNGCNNRVIISEYGIDYTFHAGENIIEFTPTETGSFSYCCWMGMIYGTILVTGD